jgi:hypothetical protein
MPDALTMNSVLEGASAVIAPDAMAVAWAWLCLWTYSLNDATSSSFEIDCAGVNNPVPVNANAGTPHPLVLLE